MKNEIKNRCVGEWKSFDEGEPPEIKGTIISVSREGSKYFSFLEWQPSALTWINLEGDACFREEYAAADIAGLYDAFCVIRGPWEDKDTNL